MSSPPQLGNRTIGCLMYADDLIIISETPLGLQWSLNKLYDYCKKWKLRLNVKKSKVMIIQKKKNVKLVKFKFGDDTLDITDTYNYLGLLFTSNGSMKDAVQCLKSKGFKALFHMNSALHTGLTFSPDVPLKVFDSTIRPIITYGCEAWVSDFSKLLFKTKDCDKAPFEQVNNKVCKQILGVPSRASNFAVKAEIGREPIFSFICSQTIRFWIRIMEMTNDRLLKQAYLSELEIYRKGKDSWAAFIFQLLKVIKLEDIIDTPPQNKGLVHDTKDRIRTSFKKLYFDSQFSMVNDNSKLRTYIMFKNNHCEEKYLSITNVPQNWRRLYCNFRISCHDLEIERGRYSVPKKPPEERICKLCKLESETEKHFILFCPEYLELRKTLMKEASKLIPNFYFLEHQERFRILLNSQNESIIKLTMEFISKAYKMRSILLKSAA